MLIVVSSIQWVGVHLCYQVDYFMEKIEEKATPLEAEIASGISEKTGLEVRVKQIEEGRIVPPVGQIYGDFFVFSEEVDTGTVYYTIDERGPDYDEKAFVVQDSNSPEKEGDSPKTGLFKRLFTDFLMPISTTMPVNEDSYLAGHYQLVYSHQNFQPTIPSPPPDLA